MKSSEEIKDLADALAKAQGAMAPAKKTAENPFYKHKYADLASVWDVCRVPLEKNGLSIIQTTSVSMVRGDDTLYLQTILLHSTGQYIESEYPVNPTKDDPQGLGSAITYARRYSLMAMIGIAPEDDDAEGAIDRKETKVKPVAKAKISAKAKVEAPPGKKAAEIESGGTVIPPFADTKEFAEVCAGPPLNIMPSKICEALGIKNITDIEDFTKAYQDLLGIFNKE